MDPEAKAAQAPLRDNVVILTIGWTGSSVLAGLLRAAGYWAGETFRKPDYDTHENVELVRLDRAVLTAVGANENYAVEFCQRWLDDAAALRDRLDLAPYRAFLERCERHAPWVWKDPRLWVAIRFWHALLPRGRVKYILLTREPLQAWISCILRRQIQTYAYLRRYTTSVEATMRAFLDAQGAPYLRLVYEDLQVEPERELARLSRFLGIHVGIEHLRATYDGPLRKRSRGALDAATAGFVYLKNFTERLR